MFRLPFILASVFLVVFSCQKEDQPDDPPGNRLKMISTRAGDSVWFRSFLYDDRNRLIAVLDSGNNGNKYRRIISYDAQGKILNVADGGSTVTFDFDVNGRITRKWGTRPWQQSVAVQNTYGYDINGRVISDSMYSYSPQVVNSIVSYLYDQRDNVIESKTIETNAGALISQQHCIYDSHPNPLQGLSIMTYLFVSGYDIPEGKNNLLKVTYHDGTEVNYTYEYYSNGLPKSRFLVDSADPLVIQTDYYYE